MTIFEGWIALGLNPSDAGAVHDHAELRKNIAIARVRNAKNRLSRIN